MEKRSFAKERPENPTDAYAVAVIASSIVVGNVPRKISAACSLFQYRNGSTVHVDNAINGLYISKF